MSLRPSGTHPQPGRCDSGRAVSSLLKRKQSLTGRVHTTVQQKDKPVLATSRLLRGRFVLLSFLGDVGLKLFAIDLAVLVGVDFIEVIRVSRTTKLVSGQAAVGVPVQGVKVGS